MDVTVFSGLEEQLIWADHDSVGMKVIGTNAVRDLEVWLLILPDVLDGNILGKKSFNSICDF